MLGEPRVDGSSENIGAVTGLFFEQAVVGLIVPAIRAQVSTARFFRNTRPRPGGVVDKLPRDPDLQIIQGARIVVFEMKVSPKKRDLSHVRHLRERYTAAGVCFLAVGGFVNVNRETLEAITTEGWFAFVQASKRNASLLANAPRLDDLVQLAVKWLRSDDVTL
jgi:hypothetical protein